MSFLSFIYWGVSPEIVKLGPVSIRWYGLLFALGFVVGYYIMAKIYTDEKKSQKDLEALTIYMILGTVIGARLGHCLFYEPAHYLANPVEILMVWHGGLASHGAGLGILISLWLYSRNRKQIEFSWIIDRVAIVIALAAFFVRLGNFFNSEILGRPTDNPWAVVFSRIDLIPRHPAQLYEGLTYLILFAILYYYYNKRKSSVPRGQLMGMFLVILFGARFFLEFFKDVQVPFEKTLPIDMGQILSIPFVLLGLFFIIQANRRVSKKELV